MLGLGSEVRDLLDEVSEEARGAVDHAGGLRLLCLGAGDSQSIVHVALLVQDSLRRSRKE